MTVEAELVLVLVVMAEVAAVVELAIDGAEQHHGVVDQVHFVTSVTVVAAVAVLSVDVVAVLTESSSPEVVVDDAELVAIVETVDDVVEPVDLAVV